MNGSETPNTFAIDLYHFERIVGNAVFPLGYDLSLNTLRIYCKKGAGQYYAALIQRNDWEILEDYPHKF